MTESSLTCISNLWAWAQANDIPNWVAVAFTGIAWPVALFFWQRRKINSVAGLEVHFSAGNITIASKPYSAVEVQFTNHTGSVVYISGVRIRSCTRNFPVPVEAARDIAQGSYHLKFIEDSGQFVLREITLQTNTSARTCMPASPGLSNGFYTHSPSWIARLFRRQNYFVLEYTAMVGTARHAIATIY
jgi:hypothetical protein